MSNKTALSQALTSDSFFFFFKQDVEGDSSVVFAQYMYIFGWKGFGTIFFYYLEFFVGLFLQDDFRYWCPQQYIWMKI